MKLPDIPFSKPDPEPRPSFESLQEKRATPIIESPKIPSYRSFADASRRINMLSNPDWTTSVNSDNILLVKRNPAFIVPEYEIFIDPSLEYTIRVYCHALPSCHPLYTNYDKSCSQISVPVLFDHISNHHICPGVKILAPNVIPHVLQKVYDIQNPSRLQQLVYYRSINCSLLIHKEEEICKNCFSINRIEIRKENNKNSKSKTPVSLNAPLSATSSSRLIASVKDLRQENKMLKKEIEELKKEIDTSSVNVSQDLHQDLTTLFSQHLEDQNVPPFMKLFWQEQQKYIKTSKNGVRYHPQIIRYCLNIAAKSPGVYDELRYDREKGTGCIILPSRRRLRDYKNYIRPERGLNPKIVDELIDKTKSFTDIERFTVISFDEMKIQDNLVWDKHNGDLIGYVDLGDDTINHATLNKVDTLATHVLVFFY